MGTLFKQVADNAISIVTTDMSNVGVTSVTLSGLDGNLFPQPGNGFYLTLWNNTTYASNPAADPNMEKVLCTARSGNTLTITTTTKPHAGSVTAALLDVAQNTTDMQTAINVNERNISILTGGTAGQILAKNSSTDYDAAWLKPSDLVNDSVVITDSSGTPWLITVATDGALQSSLFSGTSVAGGFLSEDGSNYFVTEDNLSYLSQEG